MADKNKRKRELVSQLPEPDNLPPSYDGHPHSPTSAPLAEPSTTSLTKELEVEFGKVSFEQTLEQAGYVKISVTPKDPSLEQRSITVPNKVGALEQVMAFRNPFSWETEGKGKQELTMKAKPPPLIVQFYDPDFAAGDVRGRTLSEILQWEDEKLEMSHDYIQWLFPLPEGSIFNYNAPIITEEVLEAFRESDVLRRRLNLSFLRILRFYGFTVSTEPETKSKGSNEQAKDEEQKSEEKEKSEAESTEAAPVKNTEEAEPQTNDESPAKGADPGRPREDSLADTSHDSASDTTTKPDPPKYIPSSSSALLEPSMDYHVIRGPNWKKASRNWCRRADHNHLRITRILRSLRVLGLQKECDAFYKALKRIYKHSNIHIGEMSMTFWRRAVEQPLHIAPDGERVRWLQRWVESRSKKPVQEGETEEEAKADAAV